MSSEDEKSTPAWRELETQVTEIYAAHGYRVTRGHRVAGNQVDLIAEQDVPGAPPLRLVVEVKSTDGDTVPKARVNEYVPTALAMLHGGGATGVVMVGNRPFTEAGHEAAEAADRRILLLSVEELTTGLAVSAHRLRSILTHIQLELLPHHYIDCDVRSVAGARLDLGATTVADAADRLPAGGTLVLLGDYGTGKTTAMRRVHAAALAHHLRDRTAPIPVFVELRDLGRLGSVDALVDRAAEMVVNGPAPGGQLRRLLREGRLLLLLDGLDEAAVQTSADDRRRHLEELAPLLFSPSRAIVSTRASWFASLGELADGLATVAARYPTLSRDRRADLLRPAGQVAVERHLDKQRRKRNPGAPLQPSWATIELRPLGPDQIEEYLDSYRDELLAAGWGGVDEVLAFLADAYDLDDLVTRPILLEMVVDLMVDGDIRPDRGATHMTVSEIYAASVHAKLTIDDEKRPPGEMGMLLAQRRDFSERCAWKMLEIGEIELTGKQVAECAARVTDAVRPRRPSVDPDRTLGELRTCSFLTVLGDDSMRFVHTSYYEYFAACRLMDRLLLGHVREVQRELPIEVLAFLGDLAETQAESEPRVMATLRDTALATGDGKGPRTARGNAASALLAVAEEVSGLDLVDLDVLVRRRRTLRLTGCDLRSVRIEVQGAALELVDCVLDDVTLMADAVLISGSTGTASSVDARAVTVEASAVDLSLVPSAWETCRVTGSRTRLDVRGRGSLTAVGSVVVVDDASALAGGRFEAEGSLLILISSSLHAGRFELGSGAIVVSTAPLTSHGRVILAEGAGFVWVEPPPDEEDDPWEEGLARLALRRSGQSGTTVDVARLAGERIEEWGRSIHLLPGGPLDVRGTIRDLVEGPDIDGDALWAVLRDLPATVEVPSRPGGLDAEGGRATS